MNEQQPVNPTQQVEQPKKNLPKYTGDGIAVWENLDKNGNKYLSIKILNSINIAAFENKPKQV